MGFPAALFATIGLLAIGTFAASLLVSAGWWCFALVTMRIRAPRWMGMSEWAGPIFVVVFALPVTSLVVWWVL